MVRGATVDEICEARLARECDLLIVQCRVVRSRIVDTVRSPEGLGFDGEGELQVSCEVVEARNGNGDLLRVDTVGIGVRIFLVRFEIAATLGNIEPLDGFDHRARIDDIDDVAFFIEPDDVVGFPIKAVLLCDVAFKGGKMIVIAHAVEVIEYDVLFLLQLL